MSAARDSLRELLEICRTKCSPQDEVILPSGKTNHQALLDATAALDVEEEQPAASFKPLPGGWHE